MMVNRAHLKVEETNNLNSPFIALCWSGYSSSRPQG